MHKRLLVTRPQYGGDGGIYYLFHWSIIYIKFAKTKGNDVLDLDGKRANKKELTSIIEKTKPHLICFNGHGSYNSIAGQDGETLVKMNDNEKILQGTIVSILACSSGKLLAPSCIKNGTEAVIAYKEEFWLLYNTEGTSRPLTDKIAKFFLEPANEVINCLLKGHTVESSYNKSQRLYQINIQKVLSRDSSFGYLAKFLIWDMVNQVHLGNQHAAL